MFNQQYSLDQSGSQHSSQQSQTFLTVPRLIQQNLIQEVAASCNAYKQVVQKHVNFEDPQSLYKSEHKESLEEGELVASRQSIDRRDFNSNNLDEVEENYKSLKLFQIEMQHVTGKKLISKSRKLSDTSDMNSKPNLPRKLSENVRKASSSFYDSNNVSPKFKASNSPLLNYEFPQKDEVYQYTVWPKKTILVFRFLGKMLRIHPSKIKKPHLFIIHDLGSQYIKQVEQNHIFDPDDIKIFNYCIFSTIIQIILIFFAFFKLAFNYDEILYAFIGFNLMDFVIQSNIGFYENEQLITLRWKIIKQSLIYNILIFIGALLTIFLYDWFIFLILLRLKKISDKMPTQYLYLCISILFIQIGACIWCKLIDDETFIESSKYIYSVQWSIYQLTNSGTTEYMENDAIKILSSILTLLGLCLQIMWIKFLIEYKKSPQTLNYPVSRSLNNKINNFVNRKTIQQYTFNTLRLDLQIQSNHEMYYDKLKEIVPFSDEFREILCQRIKTSVYIIGSYIVRENQILDKLLLLLEGNVAEFKNNCQISTNRMPNESFYRQKRNPLSLKATSDCLIAYIELDDFLQDIKHYQKDFEFYSMQKDNYKEYCQCCGYRGHNFDQCKQVFYVPNYKKLIKEHNTSEPNERENQYRDDGRHKINALLNKNLICITAISFSITNKLRSEQELTNEYMSKLQGSTNNFEDSILNDFQEERSSRYSVYQKYGTQDQKNLNSPQNTYSSQTHQQSLPPPIKLEERESTYNSRKIQAISKHMDHTQSINSIKVNLVKSSVSNDFQVKRNQNNKKQTSSSSSLNKRMQSTSIMQPKSFTGSIIPQVDDYDDGLDRVQSYEYYYPANNIESIARCLNRRKIQRAISFV